MIRIAVLGSTGSIGRSALEVIQRHPGQFKVTCLVAEKSSDALEAQVALFNPRLAVLADETVPLPDGDGITRWASGWEAGNYRYVVPAGQGGKYLVFGQLTMQNAGANVITQIKLIPFKNDAVYSVMDFTWAGITNTQTVSGTWVMDLAASDNCDLRGWMTTSSGTNYFNGFGSEYNCFFAGFKLIGI